MQSYSLTGLPFRWLDRHPRAAEILFDYYAGTFRGADRDISRIALPASYHDQFPLPKAGIIGVDEVSRLRLAAESRNYLEVDLVVAHGVDGPYLVDPQTAMR